jgi:hypothetical protein
MQEGSGGQEGTWHIGIAQNLIRLINNGHFRSGCVVMAVFQLWLALALVDEMGICGEMKA